MDGGQQFFTRAIDFGFSKDYRETLRIWDKQQVLADVVRVIRTFRPDVVITRFSPEPGNTHGHHTASAVLALEAFKLAGDPKAFPDQLDTLTPWQPKRIFMNGRGGGGLPIDISGDDPVSGESFAKMAARSRSMHKTQGFGNFNGFGVEAEVVVVHARNRFSFSMANPPPKTFSTASIQPGRAFPMANPSASSPMM